MGNLRELCCATLLRTDWHHQKNKETIDWHHTGIGDRLKLRYKKTCQGTVSVDPRYETGTLDWEAGAETRAGELTHCDRH